MIIIWLSGFFQLSNGVVPFVRSVVYNCLYMSLFSFSFKVLLPKIIKQINASFPLKFANTYSKCRRDPCKIKLEKHNYLERFLQVKWDNSLCILINLDPRTFFLFSQIYDVAAYIINIISKSTKEPWERGCI